MEHEPFGHRPAREPADRIGRHMCARQRQAHAGQLFRVGDLLPQRRHARVTHLDARGAQRVARERFARREPRGVVLEAGDDRERRVAREHGVHGGDRAPEHREHRGLAPRPRGPAGRIAESRRVDAPHHADAPHGRGRQLEARLHEHAERATRAHEQPMHGMARDVLHHAATRVRQHAVAGHEARAQDAIARCAQPAAAGATRVRGQHATQRRAPRLRGLER